MKLDILLQYIIPKQAITSLAGKLANKKARFLTTATIKWFIKRYQVNMSEAVDSDPANYATFNEFFTRPIKKQARVIANSDFICPVDGAISQFGNINIDQIFQAKKHNYSTATLLAGNNSLANQFNGGSFACLYLSPKDYHRIHMPCDGTLKSMAYVPGDLFSVNPSTAENVPNLFARNERLVCEFLSEKHGTFVMVLVGATIVGSMATAWHGIVNPQRNKKIKHWDYSGKNIQLTQGEEMGRFLLGSTVVMLFEKNTLTFNTNWHAGETIQLGEVMGVA